MITQAHESCFFISLQRSCTQIYHSSWRKLVGGWARLLMREILIHARVYQFCRTIAEKKLIQNKHTVQIDLADMMLILYILLMYFGMMAKNLKWYYQWLFIFTYKKLIWSSNSTMQAPTLPVRQILKHSILSLSEKVWCMHYYSFFRKILFSASI